MKKLFRRVQNQKKNFDKVKEGSISLSDLRDGESQHIFRYGKLFKYTRVGKKLFKQHLEQENRSKLADRSELGSYLGTRPNFDSGWRAVEDETAYDFKHGLGTKFLKMETFFKDSSGRIFNVTNSTMDLNEHDRTSDSGLSFYMKDNDTLTVGTGNEFVFIYDNALSSASSVAELDAGYIRIFCWKFFPSHEVLAD